MDLCAGLGAEPPLPVFAVVKEVEAPPEDEVPADKMLGVDEFEKQYFCGPLYLADDDRALYEFLGNNTMFTLT